MLRCARLCHVPGTQWDNKKYLNMKYGRLLSARLLPDNSFLSLLADYSMLIYMQLPDTPPVAGLNKWRNQFEHHVKKDEYDGITSIAPTLYK